CGGLKDWAKINRGDAEFFEMVEMFDHANQIAGFETVCGRRRVPRFDVMRFFDRAALGETVGKDLIKDGVLDPVGSGNGHGGNSEFGRRKGESGTRKYFRFRPSAFHISFYMPAISCSTCAAAARTWSRLSAAAMDSRGLTANALRIFCNAAIACVCSSPSPTCMSTNSAGTALSVPYSPNACAAAIFNWMSLEATRGSPRSATSSGSTTRSLRDCPSEAITWARTSALGSRNCGSRYSSARSVCSLPRMYAARTRASAFLS